MSSRASTAGRDDHAIFVKGGAPVKFCFHRSVTQGRGQITRDVERHGGEIVQDERYTNVLLVDEQEDIAFIRRRYYHSTELYRLRIFVEPRGFVQECIRDGEYRHDKPVRQTMQGRVPGRGRRTAFTQVDKDHLAFYIATYFPTQDGRLGMKAYKHLEELGRSDDRAWEWARRHTAHSWREHYKKNPETMDERIKYYLGQLKNVGGHQLGHDPRRHNHQYLELRQEEEEESEEEQEQPRERERQVNERGGQARPVVAAARPAQVRDYLARHEKELVTLDEEEEEEEGESKHDDEDLIQRIRAKRNAEHLRDQQMQAKRTRIKGASPDDGIETDREAGEKDSYEELPSIEGSDLFGDRAYESPFTFEDQSIDFPEPFPPRSSPVPQQDGPPPSTQATLVASPVISRKELALATGPAPREVIDARASTPQQSTPPSPPQTVPGRAGMRRARMRGASAQPGPSLAREKRIAGDVAPQDAPYRNTRARSRSIGPQPQTGSLHQEDQDRGRKEKGKAKEEALVPIEEDVIIVEMEGEAHEDVGSIPVTGGLSTRETFEDEQAVEGLLEGVTRSEVNEELGDGNGNGGSVVSVADEENGEHGDEGEDGGSDDGVPGLPSFQDFGIRSPLDSDDAETHARLIRDAEEGSAAKNGSDEEEGLDHVQEQEQDQYREEDSSSDSGDEDADRIERMAKGSLYVASAPSTVQPRVTRSMATRTRTQTETQSSPLKTRSARKATLSAAFPSPGTKARAVVDRFKDEERRVPYAPPAGSRAAKEKEGMR